MSGLEEPMAFERRLRELLERDAGAASGHVRSRLTQARHAALARAAARHGARRPGLPGRRIWLPAAGALFVALCVTWWVPRRVVPPPFAAGAAEIDAQDMTLLTDRDGLALVEGGDGRFYEWAAAQARSAPVPGAGVDEPGKNGG